MISRLVGFKNFLLVNLSAYRKIFCRRKYFFQSGGIQFAVARWSNLSQLMSGSLHALSDYDNVQQRRGEIAAQRARISLRMHLLTGRKNRPAITINVA